MNIVNEYKIKDGTTLDDIRTELKKKRLPISEGYCSYIHKDGLFCTTRGLIDDISCCVAFPEDLSKWDSFDFVLIMDESFGQPYYPFYKADENKKFYFSFVLNVIGHYNKFMDSLSFLEKLEGEELEQMKKRHME